MGLLVSYPKDLGAHVIPFWTEGRQPDDQSLREAALAALVLPGGGRGRGPVDYTPVKYVKKP